MKPLLSRMLRYGLCAVLWMIALGACSVAAPSPTPEPPTALPPTVTVAPTMPPVTATPATPALTLWVAEEGQALATVQTLAAAFAAANGTPLKVIARPPDSLRLSLATAALNGDPLPDLLWGDGETLAGLIIDGRIQPLEQSAAATDTLPALRTAATTGNKLWGVPVSANGALLLLWNRKLVRTPPTTSDELIVQSRAAETPEVAGLVQAWNESRWLLPWLYAFGGAPTSADGTQITLDTPAMTATLNLMRELYATTPSDGDGYSRGQRLFSQGYAALAIDGDWSLATYRAVSDTLDLGLAPLPKVPATGRAAAPPLGGTYLMLADMLAGKPREAALAFGSFLTQPDTQAQLALGLGRLPATQAALNAPVKPWAADPALAAAAVLAGEAPGLPPTAATRCALYGIDMWLPTMLKERIEPAETPATMQSEAEACLKRGS